MAFSSFTRAVLSSRVVARAFPFKRPPVLLLSYPRSGSSWVGAMLSRSPDAAYLREPVTQLYLDDTKKETVIEPELDEAMCALYTRLADRAFRGVLPWKLENVIESTEQFSLLGRKHRHLIIKEVNPLAAGLYVRRYWPKVVTILRHPAAVASSYERLGWLDGAFEELGFLYGTHLAAAIEACKNGWHSIVRFEDLAQDPRGGFIALFRSLDLRLPEAFDDLLTELCEARSDAYGAYDVRRASAAEAFKWKQSLSRADIDAVMRGYLRSPLPYYRDDL